VIRPRRVRTARCGDPHAGWCGRGQGEPSPPPQFDEGRLARRSAGPVAYSTPFSLYVAGLATDYCVKQSILDVLRLGFEVIVLEDAVAAVDGRPGDGDKALEEMVAAGAKLATTG
jgi:hypothetical protein